MKLENKSGIYKILNLANNKFYVGSALNLNSRFRQHRLNLEQNKHINKHLQASFNKYGAHSFEFHILEVVENATKELLEAREQYWLDCTKCYNKEIGYNKRKLAESNRGYSQSNLSVEKRRLANLGKKRSKETCEKLKNRIVTDEWRENISKSQIGKKVSNETKNLLLIYASRPKSQETKDKISNSLKFKNRPVLMKLPIEWKKA